jgi:GTP 3',8-cyclase
VSDTVKGLDPIRDLLGRPLRNLRLSVTDRCNLRCSYCMPEAEYVWLPRHDILHFEEMSTLIDVFARAGVDRVRLTGGEPLLRRDLPELIRMIARKPAIRDLALTTNGVMLGEQARALHLAGLHRLTVSLDTLRADRFQALTRFDSLNQVLSGIDEAVNHFECIKLDAVIIRGTNDDELVPLLEYAKRIGAELRFIEYMDVGGATQWSRARVMSRPEMLAVLGNEYGPITPIVEATSAPADRFRLPDGTAFGIISSTTEPFCSSCDRSRLTADGVWYRCLYATTGTDLRAPLRAGMSPDNLLGLVTQEWAARADRGAEERLAVRDRSPLVPASSLKKNPHLEMHTRGG